MHIPDGYERRVEKVKLALARIDSLFAEIDERLDGRADTDTAEGNRLAERRRLKTAHRDLVEAIRELTLFDDSVTSLAMLRAAAVQRRAA